MDYSDYQDFPFPSLLTPQEETLKAYFLALPDGDQLKLLNASSSYEEFRGRVAQHRDVMQILRP